MALPFANDYFDAVVCIDSYHFFATDENYFDEKLRPLLKKNSDVVLTFPGLNYEISTVPSDMKEFWDDECLSKWHCIEWWRERLESSISNFKIDKLECFDESWRDWLTCDNPYAVEDREMMRADGGKYMVFFKVTGKTK
ncbi:MAG: hypothetical protein RR272_01275 [Synergistaceae bacterium]